MRRGRPLRLTHVLLACDLNAVYLDFWPLARRAWAEIAGLEPRLVLVAEPGDVPEPLRGDPHVQVFPPVPHVHTAFQAQCIRLLYPAVLDADGAVLVSDADMTPLNRRYFQLPGATVDESHFLVYRDVLLDSGQIPICYNAALPATWGDVFGIATVADVRHRLEEWGAEATDYSGERGGAGWVTDQRILYRTVVDHGRRTRIVWILDDRFTGFRRLERGSFWESNGLTRGDRWRLRHGRYSDYHCVGPQEQFHDLNELVVGLAIEGAQRANRRRRG